MEMREKSVSVLKTGKKQERDSDKVPADDLISDEPSIR